MGNAIPIRCVAISPSGKLAAVTSEYVDQSEPLSIFSKALVAISRSKSLRLLKSEIFEHSLPINQELEKLPGILSLLCLYVLYVFYIVWLTSLQTTCGQDGRIIVWDLNEEQATVLKTIDGIIPVVDSESPSFSNDCSAVWHPSGKQFYVATRTHEIVAISQENWTKIGTFSDEELSGVIVELFSVSEI